MFIMIRPVVKYLVKVHDPREAKGLRQLISEVDRSRNRLSFSVIIAGILVGSSLIVNLKVGPLLFGLPVIGLVGYFAAGVLGLWLLIAIMRSGRL